MGHRRARHDGLPACLPRKTSQATHSVTHALTRREATVKSSSSSAAFFWMACSMEPWKRCSFPALRCRFMAAKCSRFRYRGQHSSVYSPRI